MHDPNLKWFFLGCCLIATVVIIILSVTVEPEISTEEIRQRLNLLDARMTDAEMMINRLEKQYLPEPGTF